MGQAKLFCALRITPTLLAATPCAAASVSKMALLETYYTRDGNRTFGRKER